MKNSMVTNVSSEVPRWRRGLAAMWHWLIEPSPSVIGPERRLQARLLMAMLLTLIIVGVLALAMSLFGVYIRPGDPTSVTYSYLGITLGCILLLAVEYALSRTRHFPLAALLAVGTVLGANFVTVTINPQDLRSSSFLILGGLIGSLFLSVRTTALVFFVTFMGLLLLPAFVPGFSLLNNLNTLFLILTVGGLVVMAATLRQRYLEQIDRQTQQLVQSEARLRELAIHDPLTGLFNRRYLEEAHTLEMLRAGRKQYPIGIIMADVDHFKRFNDTHGHAAGDAVLILVGSFLRAQVRSSDVACRYGGEEFILILPEASREITEMRAESIRQGIKLLPVQYDGQTLEAVRLSMGIAIFPEHGSTKDAILRAADEALYRAKNGGRDQVVVAD